MSLPTLKFMTTVGAILFMTKALFAQPPATQNNAVPTNADKYIAAAAAVHNLKADPRELNRREGTRRVPRRGLVVFPKREEYEWPWAPARCIAHIFENAGSARVVYSTGVAFDSA
ncbi:MAG: hypothetical protein NTW86_01630 [Candidatus Sumerlaeota bacterium]|nr:hypothetical protein [Candidatus Sumerlaeota bacterium]